MNEREQFKLVPIEPTEEMIKAGWDVEELVTPHKTWEAMLEAAPSQPAQEDIVHRCLKKISDFCPPDESIDMLDSSKENQYRLTIAEVGDTARAALQAIEAQPAQEPFGYYVYVKETNNAYFVDDLDDAQSVDDATNNSRVITKLYTEPPSEAARIAELELQVAGYQELIGQGQPAKYRARIAELEAKLADYIAAFNLVSPLLNDDNFTSDELKQLKAIADKG